MPHPVPVALLAQVKVACGRKHKHASRGAAEAQLLSLLRMDDTNGRDRLHLYKCGFCDGWHVGHKRLRRAA